MTNENVRTCRVEVVPDTDPLDPLEVGAAEVERHLPTWGSGEFVREVYVTHAGGSFSRPSLQGAREALGRTRYDVQKIKVQWEEDWSLSTAERLVEETGDPNMLHKIISLRSRKASVQFARHMFGPPGRASIAAAVVGPDERDVHAIADAVQQVLESDRKKRLCSSAPPPKGETVGPTKSLGVSFHPTEPATKSGPRSLLGRFWRTVSDNALIASLVATVVGGLIVYWVVEAVTR